MIVFFKCWVFWIIINFGHETYSIILLGNYMGWAELHWTSWHMLSFVDIELNTHFYIYFGPNLVLSLISSVFVGQTVKAYTVWVLSFLCPVEKISFPSPPLVQEGRKKETTPANLFWKINSNYFLENWKDIQFLGLNYTRLSGPLVSSSMSFFIILKYKK